MDVGVGESAGRYLRPGVRHMMNRHSAQGVQLLNGRSLSSRDIIKDTGFKMCWN